MDLIFMARRPPLVEAGAGPCALHPEDTIPRLCRMGRRKPESLDYELDGSGCTGIVSKRPAE